LATKYLTFQIRPQTGTTSEPEIEETDSDIAYNDEEPSSSIPPTTVFSETSLSQQSYTNTPKVDLSLALAKEVEKQASKYINRDIASEASRTYQMDVLAGKKLIYNKMDVLELQKKVLCVLVSLISITMTAQKFLPDDFKHFVADQLQDPEIEA
ncbi:11295_t:CDS:2, partial [Ambispora leptoticha]